MKKITKTLSKTKAAKPKAAKPPARRAIAVTKTAAKARPQPVKRAPQAPVGPDPVKEFAAAMKFFQAGDFKEAKKLFERLADSAVREVGHAALLHARMCEQRLMKAAPRLSSAEDFYNYAIAQINLRNLEEARRQLDTALKMAPQADHICYAMALCVGLLGDLQGACTYLRRAIEIQPRNRVLARNDPDFAEIARRHPLSDLLSRASQ